MMNRKSIPKPLSDLVGRAVGGTFRRQGFSSFEIVTRWEEIVGVQIAACAEPIRMQWIRSPDPDEQAPATLVLRVEGPAALEVQHQAGVIIERVNRYLGWQAVAKLAFRQAPLARRKRQWRRPAIDADLAAEIARNLPGVADDGLRAALGRLGAAIKRR
jgi:hypothetical protein